MYSLSIPSSVGFVIAQEKNNYNGIKKSHEKWKFQKKYLQATLIIWFI